MCTDWLKGVWFSALDRPSSGGGSGRSMEAMSSLLADVLVWADPEQGPVPLLARPDSGQIPDQ